MTLQVVTESLDVTEVSPAPSSSVRVRMAIATDADVFAASEQARRLASRLDFSSTDITVITAAIIEVARNVLTYGERGDLMLHLIQRRGRLGLAIVARDKGPGMSDVRQALRDTIGLASARRLMDEFRVRSEPGRGTTITMRKWTRCRQVERAGARRLGHAGLRKAR